MKSGSRYGTIRVHPGRRRALTRTVAAALTIALAIGLTLAFGTPSSSGSAAQRPGSRLVPSPAARPARVASNARGIVARVEPGVVIIDTRLRYNGEAAAGTGMVINPDGLVLTNNHVIEDATSITATVAGKTYQARVAGYDKPADIALIKLQGAPRLPTVPVGNSSLVTQGQAVVALGNAGGHAVLTTSPGTVTKLNQTVMAKDQVGSASAETLHGMLQSSAGLQPGDSGGPLAGIRGVIGMDTAANDFGNQQAIGYAIPINTALSVAGQIAAGNASPAITIGYPPFVGAFIAAGSDPSPRDQAQQGESQPGAPASPAPSCYASDAGLTPPSAIAPVNSGVLVKGVICASPAARAGLTGGDVITAVNGQSTTTPAALTSVLARFRPGDTISVTWVHPSGMRTTSRIGLTAGPPQ